MFRSGKRKPTEYLYRGLWFPLILFCLIAVLTTLDIVVDLASGTTVLHVLIESLLVLAATVGAIYFWSRLRTALSEERRLKRDLKKVREETAHWQEEQRELLANLQIAIEKQFTKWDLSPTEKEIAFYLLKGLSLKEIAELRSSTTPSVKQQAYVLYHKAGLAGRAELSAHFLGGLLQPD